MGNLFKFLVVAVLVYGGWRHFTAEKAAEKSAAQLVTADIEIDTTSFCGECKRTKQYLDSQGIAYLEKDVEKDLDNRRELRARGGYGVPYFFVPGKPMVGFDSRAIVVASSPPRPAPT